MSTPNNPESLGLSILDSIANENLTDLASDASELVLDGITSASDAIEAVPVFGSAVKLVRAGLAMREKLFMRKLSRFLLQLQGIKPEEKQAFIREMVFDPDFKKRVGENLVLVLDRLNDMEKADVLGRLFRAYVAGRIDYPLFGRFAGIVDRAFLPDLFRLRQFNADSAGDDAVFALESLGLVYLSVIGGGNASLDGTDGGSAYAILPLGQKLAELLFF
ncbi:hypothetical protein GCM10027594_05120 [Hymenobacter agri]